MKKHLNTMLLTALAMTACSLPMHSELSPNGAERMSPGSGKVKPAVPVRDSKGTTIEARQPGASGLTIRHTPGNRIGVSTRKIGNGASIYGYLCTTGSEEQDPGLYEFTPEGYNLVWVDSYKLQNGGSTIKGGWINGDKFCGYSTYIFWGMVFTFDYVELNMTDGSVVTSSEFDYYRYPNISTAAFNSAEKAIYGYASDPENGAKGWVRADVDNPCEPAFQRVLSSNEEGQVCYSLTYNPDDDYFYGINNDQKFVRIDSEGNQTVISEVPDAEQMDVVQTGLTYSPKENLFYWNANLKSAASSLFSITTAGVFTKLTDFSDSEEFTTMVTTDAYTNVDKPGRPEIVSVAFPSGSNSGAITFAMPSTYFDGTQINGNLEWHGILDGEAYKNGTAVAGANVEVNYTELSDGYHTFAFSATNNGVEGPRVSRRLFIGVDTPSAPENVVLTKENVSWDAVTTGANNGYVDPAAITYEVKVDGQSYGTTSDTNMDITLPSGDIRLYNAEVYAICQGKVSAPGTSNSVAHGDDMKLPVHFYVTEDEFNLMTIVDCNDDGQNFWYRAAGLPVILADWCDEDMESMDDYIFFPAIYFDSAEKMYTYNMDILSFTCRYPDEYYEVVLATSPTKEGVISKIIDRTVVPAPAEGNEDPDLPDMEDVETLFSVPAAGTYYVGIHSLSLPYQLGFFVHDINITDDNVTPNAPAKPTEIKASEAGSGELAANVEVTIPTKNVSGGDLEDADITVIATGEEAVSATGRPGSKVSLRVPTKQGNNKISVVLSNANGNSTRAFVEVFTGIHTPAPISNLDVNVSTDMRTAFLSWPKVTASFDGGYLNPATVEYDILLYGPGASGYNGWQNYDSAGTNNSYEFTPDKQDLHTVAVESRNEAGSCGKVYYANIHAGPAYALPFEEVFPDGYIESNPWLTYPLDDTYTATLSTKKLCDIDERWADMEDYALIATTEQDQTSGLWGIPRFSTMGMIETGIDLEMMTGPKSATVLLYASNNMNAELEHIGTVTQTADGLQTIHIDLPESMLNREWVQLYILCRFPTADKMFVMNSIKVAGVSSVGEVVRDEMIRGGKGEITFCGFNGKNIEIYALDGKLMKRTTAAANVEIVRMEKGVYVAKASNTTAKVIVK